MNSEYTRASYMDTSTHFTLLIHRLIAAPLLPPMSFILLFLCGLWLYHRDQRWAARSVIISTFFIMYALSTPLVALLLNRS